MLIKITADQLPGEAQEAKITRIYPQVGEEIQAGESLVDMEANKQRMTLSSPAAGIVEELYVDTGQIIKKGQLLLTVQGEKMEVQTTSQTGFNYFGSMLKTEKKNYPANRFMHHRRWTGRICSRYQSSPNGQSGYTD